MKTCETCRWPDRNYICENKNSPTHDILVKKDFGCIHHEAKPKEPEVTVEEAIRNLQALIPSQPETGYDKTFTLAIRALEEMRDRSPLPELLINGEQIYLYAPGRKTARLCTVVETDYSIIASSQKTESSDAQKGVPGKMTATESALAKDYDRCCKEMWKEASNLIEEETEANVAAMAQGEIIKPFKADKPALKDEKVKNYCHNCDENWPWLVMREEIIACPKCGAELIDLAVPDTPTPEEKEWAKDVLRKRHPGHEPVEGE